MDYIKENLPHITKIKITTLSTIVTWRFPTTDHYIYMYVTGSTNAHIELQTQEDFFTSLQEYLPNATKLAVKKLVPS